MSNSKTWMRRCVLVCIAALAIGCGDDEEKAAEPCSVSQNDAGEAATIRCPDGTKAVVKAAPASTCSIRESSDGTKKIECSDGSSVTLTSKDGEPGPKGDPGNTGETGEQGPQGEQGPMGQPSAPGADGAQGNAGRSSTVVGAGLNIEITSVSIPDDLHPVVSLRIRDAANRPLDRAGTYTPGSISVSFVIARLTSSGGVVGEYAPYNTGTVTGATVSGVAPVLANAMQPRSENNGTWTEVDPTAGTHTYRFNQALPGDYDRSKTHTVAVYSSRTFEGVAYVSNPVFHFRPDGEAVSERREIVTTAVCNDCHGTLAEHGGSRREIGVCITCHVSGMRDPESGNSLDMAEMIHHIHRGKNLPSVVNGTPYKIVGFQNAVHDYSNNVFPQALENCETCHRDGADSDRWKTTLTRTACGACHDRVAFAQPVPATGGWKLHTGGAVTTDSLCANCHGEGTGPIATLETDVVKVHRRLNELPLRNPSTGAIISEPPQLTGSVVSVAPSGPSDTPVITFRIAVNGAPYDIVATPMNRLRFTFAGPTSDYAGYTQFIAQQSSGAVGMIAATGTAGEFTWTPPGGTTMTTIADSIGTAAAGSFAVGMEGRITGMATRADATTATVNYPMHNAVFYFAVTGGSVVPRREAVVVEKCNNCHQDLAAHGGSRNDPEYCVLCHNANKDAIDIPLPPAGETKLSASVRLSHMVHRIHTGEAGNSPYVIAGADFSEVLYPNDRRDCTVCHLESHYELPLQSLLPTHLTRIDSTGARVASSDYYLGATSAACTGCHDAAETLLHAEAMTTTSGVETCSTCHGAGKTFDVDVVHARPGL